MRLCKIRMRKKFLFLILFAAWTLCSVQAETADSHSVDGYSAIITISIESSIDSEFSDKDIEQIGQEVSTAFFSALQQTARFNSIEIDFSSAQLDYENDDPKTMIVNLILSQVLIETDPDSGKKIFYAEAAADSYSSDQNDRSSLEFNLLGMGETFEASLQSAKANLMYHIMSIVRMFPLPGSDLAINDVYNEYPLVLFDGDSAPSIGDDYTLVSGTGEVLGLAEISRLVPLEESEGSAAELQIIYTDISIVPGLGIQPLERSNIQIQSEVMLSLGAVGSELSFSGTNGLGFVPSAGLGAVWIWEDPYPTGSFFVQQENSIIAMVSGGFTYRMIPGKRLTKPGNLFFGRIRLDLGASFIGGYFFDLTVPIENDLIYGSRYSAGISWYITDSIEVSAKGQYNRIYLLSGSTNPIFSTIFGTASVTFRP